MKKIRYIAFSLLALLFGVCLVSFIPKTDTYAETNVYEADIAIGNTFLPDYAITNVEKVSYSGNLVFSYKIDSSLLNSTFDFCYFEFGDTPSFRGYNRTFTFFYIEYDFSNYSNLCDFYCCNNISLRIESLSGNLSFGRFEIDTDGINIIKDSGIYSVSITFENVSYDLFDNLDFLVDMNSDTFSFFNALKFNLNIEDNCSYPYYLYQRFANNSLYYFLEAIPFDCIKNMVIAFDSSGTAVNLLSSSYTYVTNVLRCPFESGYASIFTNPLIFEKDIQFSFNIDYFNIDIYKPSSRMKNTLIIYNYDSNGGILPYVKYCDYTLRRNSDYYCIYAGDKNNLFIPNIFDTSQYFMFYNNDIENMVFDEYITLNFYVNYSDLPISIYEDKICFTCGFDFNFVQYTQPLVASNGAYNYDFEKPKYVDMHFSLYPFYIPILEICQNAIIFLVFYCPIISDVLALVYLDRFIGALLQIINFVLGVPIGSFVLACIGFIVYYMVFKSFMPIIYDSVGGIYHNSSYYKYNNEKKQSKKEWKYQKYKDKKLNKQINNITKKNKK